MPPNSGHVEKIVSRMLASKSEHAVVAPRNDLR